MAHVIPFELCGLHYILTCSDDPCAPGLQFRLRDEAFRGAAEAFTAWSCDDLFSRIESHIDMPLPIDLRLTLRDHLKTVDGATGWFDHMATVFGKRPVVPPVAGLDKMAVGMR